jgi:hypothetical protein
MDTKNSVAPTSATISALASYVGQTWENVSAAIDEAVHGAGLVYRWLTPSTMVDPNDVCSVRITIQVDDNHVITGFSAG